MQNNVYIIQRGPSIYICWYWELLAGIMIYIWGKCMCRCSEDRGAVCHCEQSTCRAVEIENMEILLARAKTSLPTKPRDIKKEFRGWMGLHQIYRDRNGVRIISQPARFVQKSHWQNIWKLPNGERWSLFASALKSGQSSRSSLRILGPPNISLQTPHFVELHRTTACFTKIVQLFCSLCKP